MTNEEKSERKRAIVNLLTAVAHMGFAALSLEAIEDPVYKKHAEEMVGAAEIAEKWAEEIIKEIGE